MRFANGRDPINIAPIGSVDDLFIPENPIVVSGRTDDPRSPEPPLNDRAHPPITYDPSTGTLRINLYAAPVEWAALGALLRQHNQKYGRLAKLILYVSQTTFQEQYHEFMKRGFNREESEEARTSQLALVRRFAVKEQNERQR
jgi:hypothetical protein